MFVAQAEAEGANSAEARRLEEARRAAEAAVKVRMRSVTYAAICTLHRARVCAVTGTGIAVVVADRG